MAELARLAAEARQRAHAPFSRFKVGAALRTRTGEIVTGCNIENASYGLTLCAECGLVSVLHASGGGRLTAFTCVDRSGNLLMPCGRCRQLLFEHGGPVLARNHIQRVHVDALSEQVHRHDAPGARRDRRFEL